MIKIDFYKDESVGVLGLGRTGLATATALHQGGARLLGWDDSRRVRKQAHKVLPDLELLPPEASAWSSIAALMPSPGINENYPLIKKLDQLTIPMVGDIELFAKALKASGSKAQIIAITGTNGKSTTTALTAHILKCAGFAVEMGGNIGMPVLALSPFEDERIYVLEISSYQANLVSEFAPAIAVQLNLTPDHIERHGSVEAYARAKARIFQRLGREGLAIIGTEDVFGQKLARDLAQQTNLVRLNRVQVPQESLSLQKNWKPYQLQNIAASWAIAKHLSISKEVFSLGLASFKQLPHRLEEIAHIGKTRFINDSKATNAEASLQALLSYKDIYWLAGGAAKSEDFESLRPGLKHVRHAYLFGEAAKVLENFLGKQVPSSKHSSLREATAQAYHDIKESGFKKGVVLLSPACASFDAFIDFAERGRAFGLYLRALRQPSIFIAAGGTGGGLFPAEGLAQVLRHRGFRCVLMHDERARIYIGRDLWDKHYRIFSSPLILGIPHRWLGALFKIGLGFLQSLLIFLFDRSNKVMIGFGGYPTLPSVLAAGLSRMPVLLHEPGAVLGRANRLLLPFARKLTTSQPLERGIVTGNPVREEVLRFQAVPYHMPKLGELLKLVIFAGSQGAEWFDQIVPQALVLVVSRGHRLEIVQQCRSKLEELQALYRTQGIKAKLAPFFSDLPSHIAQAHLVIARAGASTISELALLGRPAILVPLASGVSKEQTVNAEQFAHSGAGWTLAQDMASPEVLARKIEQLIEQPVQLRKAAEAAYKQRAKDANHRIADLVQEVIDGV